jgi:hypothetical protein
LGAVVLSATLDTPVEDVVVLVTLTDKEITEELAEVGVVRLVVEAKSTSIVQENPKFVGESSAKEIGRGGHLLLHDAVVLLLLGSSLEALPRQSTTQEVHEDISERLKIISAGLLDTQVSVDRGVTSCTSQILVLAVRDVEMSLWITELLRETEIDDIDLVAPLANTHEEVVGFDITMNEVSRVDVFDTGDLITMASQMATKREFSHAATYQLVSKKEDCFQAELAVAEVKEVFERRTEEVKDHGVVVAFCAKPPDERNADTAGEGLVDLGLVLELGVFGFDRLKLDGDFLARDDVDSEVDITWMGKDVSRGVAAT